jgi:CDP-diacylglycerol--glycerol-3-phosphate 3-phosphatidyltransferase
MMEEEKQPQEEKDVKEDKMYKFAAGNGIMNLPNKLTLARVLMIPLYVLFFYVSFTGHYLIALLIFIAASLTDFFDGRIARKYNLVTNLGKFLDPIADKVLVCTALILMLTVSGVFTVFLGTWAYVLAAICVAIIIAREMIVSGFRMVAADAGIVIAADKIGKYKTFAQDASIVVLLLFMTVVDFTNSIGKFAEVLDYIGLIAFLIATVLTIISGVNYIVKNISVLKA